MNISLKALFLTLTSVILLTGCESNPQNVDVKLEKSAPAPTFTIYTSAIDKLGLMTQIYDAENLRIMTTQISDNTGTSIATQAEIPSDITEMVKSSLNSIGGKITYIPYNPNFLSNNMAVGYSEFSNKLVPDVMVSGGITEFDRALVSKGKGTDIGLGGTIGGKSIGLDFTDKGKSSLARVTLDFNLVDFQTFAGIPRIQAINSMKLSAAKKETSIGFQIIGNAFGVNGDVQKVQGRHAAVRLLVQLSMIQIVGRYQGLPYWNLIPGASTDQVVVDRVMERYYALSEVDKIIQFQKLLYISGYDINITGEYDSQTDQFLKEFAAKQGLAESAINAKLYMELYSNLPINHEAKHRRDVVNNKATMTKVVRLKAPKKVIKKAKRVPKKAKQQVAETGNLKIWTDKSNYKIGDTMTVMYSVDKPMYVRLMIYNSQGKIDTLFPNPLQSDQLFEPGKTYQIPPAGAEFTLDIGGPAGIDYIKGVASKNPVLANSIVFDSSGSFDANKMKNLPIRASAKVKITK